MLPEGSIEVSDIWKRFRQDRQEALIRAQMRRLMARIRGQDAGWNWALRDINFHVEPGEAVGIVGANGSGKTTLLQVLAGVMYPYAGKIEVTGRVGALIEVRAGIHPELTGRENIFVQGTLLGLTRKHIAKRLDDIVEFAQLRDAIHRQVKHYSSGMQMRLGFAIAAFLEPAILMVDEILAVGDAMFQQRCLERMRQVQAQGTTLLFVSHDLATVEAMCGRSIWINRGIKEADGPTHDVLGAYRRSVEEFAEFASPRGGVFEVVEADVIGDGDNGLARTQSPADVRILLAKHVVGGDAQTNVVIGVTEGTATPIFVVRHAVHLPQGTTEIRCRLPRLPLPRGRFYVWAAIGEKGQDVLPWHPIAKFEVVGEDLDELPRSIVRLAPVHVESEWTVDTANGRRAGARAPEPAQSRE
jgi:ABC-2 type transport system ATP-binding protein